MAAKLIRIEGSAPWSAACRCGWRCDPMGDRGDADRAAERHRRSAHHVAAVDAARQRRYRLNAAS